MNSKFFISTFIITIALAGIVSASDVTVSRNMPSRVDPNGYLSVSLTVLPSGTVTGFDLAELIPLGWEINSWSVIGYDQESIVYDTNEQEFLDETYSAYHWQFTGGLTDSVVLTYNIYVPVSSGTYDFVGINTYPGGFEKEEATLEVAVAPETTTTVPTTTVSEETGEGVNIVETIQSQPTYVYIIALVVLVFLIVVIYKFVLGR